MECQSNNTVPACKNIQWLLSQPNSIWKEYFDSYANTLLRKLESRDNNVYDIFSQKIVEKLTERETYRKNHGNSQGFISLEFKNIAKLFSVLRHYSLSAFFYQLSCGKVPSDIYGRDQSSTKIIPTVRDDKPSKLLRNITDIFPFNK